MKQKMANYDNESAAIRKIDLLKYHFYLLSLLMPLLVSCGGSRTESGHSEAVYLKCSTDTEQKHPQIDNNLGSRHRFEVTCDRDNTGYDTNTKSDSYIKANTGTSSTSPD